MEGDISLGRGIRWVTRLALAGASLALLSSAGHAEQTHYPLRLQNCGVEVVFEHAPERAVTLGQNSAEIMYLLGLENRMAATAFWPSHVLPELSAANDKVRLLSIGNPSFEAVLSSNPDFVAAQLRNMFEPAGLVARREDFSKLGIPTYMSPSACSTRLNEGGALGARSKLWDMSLLYQEIEELAKIFDVADRGQSLIADLRQREKALREKRRVVGRDLTFVFWFSSSSPSADAWLGGKNGASGFIADVVGGRNAVTTEVEWPTLSWERIAALNPTVIVIASLDRQRFELDRPDTKIKFLTSDPVVSQLDAVKHGHIAVIDGQAMNTTVRTIYGAEQLARQLEEFGLTK